MGYHPVYIEFVENGISVLFDRSVGRWAKLQNHRWYLAQTRSENYNLIKLPHLLEEIIDTRAFDHVNIMPVVLDLYRDYVVRVLNRLIGA
jgi:hypothetical protein